LWHRRIWKKEKKEEKKVYIPYRSMSPPLYCKKDAKKFIPALCEKKNKESSASLDCLEVCLLSKGNGVRSVKPKA
jgi:hypothetical protein